MAESFRQKINIIYNTIQQPDQVAAEKGVGSQFFNLKDGAETVP
jgi:hypothetical protein